MRDASESRTARVLFVIVLVLIVVACGGQAPSTRPSKTPKPPQPQSQPVGSTAVVSPSGPIDSGAHVTPPNNTETFHPIATPPPTLSPILSPTPGPIQEPFGKHESPPDDVPDPSDLFIIPSAGNCKKLYPDPGPGQQARTFDVLRVPGRNPICLFGFPASKSLDLTITAPSGRTITRTPTTDADGAASSTLTRLPTNEMGIYRIRAQMGDLLAETTVEVRPSEFAKNLVVPEQPRLGQIVSVWYGGYPPNKALPAHLFRQDDDAKWEYVAGLGKLRFDSKGFAVIQMRSRDNDPAGAYDVVADLIEVRFELKE